MLSINLTYLGYLYCDQSLTFQQRTEVVAQYNTDSNSSIRQHLTIYRHKINIFTILTLKYYIL